MSKGKDIKASVCAALVGVIIANGLHADSSKEGIVIASQKIIHVRNNNAHPVKHYTAAGGTIGLVSGFVVGGIIAWPLGLVVGPVVYGTLGAGLGAGTGVLSSVFNPSQAVEYQYKVKSLSNSKIYAIQQGAMPIPLNTKVCMINRNKKLLIRSC